MLRYKPCPHSGGLRTGEPRYVDGVTTTDRRYTGQRAEGIGLYDYRARWYDPALGRFSQADTIVPGAMAIDFDRYAYVRNCPLRYTDPSGHCKVAQQSAQGRNAKLEPLPDYQNDGDCWEQYEYLYWLFTEWGYDPIYVLGNGENWQFIKGLELNQENLRDDYEDSLKGDGYGNVFADFTDYYQSYVLYNIFTSNKERAWYIYQEKTFSGNKTAEDLWGKADTYAQNINNSFLAPFSQSDWTAAAKVHYAVGNLDIALQIDSASLLRIAMENPPGYGPGGDEGWSYLVEGLIEWLTTASQPQ